MATETPLEIKMDIPADCPEVVVSLKINEEGLLAVVVVVILVTLFAFWFHWWERRKKKSCNLISSLGTSGNDFNGPNRQGEE